MFSGGVMSSCGRCSCVVTSYYGKSTVVISYGVFSVVISFYNFGGFL